MCGITGFFKPSGFHSEAAKATLTSMHNQFVYRGPDDAGNWLDAETGIALGHRRLSIVDLSHSGHQPMVSRSGRYVLAFNGEIYNHLEIRLQLEALSQVEWQGHSDTESLLTAIECWGLERTLKASVGMFAIALWDRKECMLSIARDRMGEKPLYYGWQGGVFLFGSELKALRAHPAFESEIDHDVLPLYLRHGYIPAPWSVWRGIRKLNPGTWMTVRASERNIESVPQQYWSFHEATSMGQAELFVGSEQEAIDTLEVTMKQAIAGQMVADVPLGAFLSGGIDSSTVVALMQAQSTQRVKTFTIGFAEAGYNEAVHAKAVATHLGTEHTEIYVTADQAREVIPRLSQMYDEPFGDSSAIPTLLVSQLARQYVTVSLSGDGGDELFGGYPHFQTSWNIWRLKQKLPRIFRYGTGLLLGSLPEFSIRTCMNSELRTKTLHTYDRVRSLGRQMRFDNLIDLFDYRRAVFRDEERIGVLKNNLHGVAWHKSWQLFPSIEALLAYEAMQYLPDDIMVKVDRASMAVSLESRAPLLDHRVVELSCRFPMTLKIRNQTGKWLLRELLYRYVPKELVDRKKAGFGIPIGDWLRGPLRTYGEELIHSADQEMHDILNFNVIEAIWKDLQQGSIDRGGQLWVVLALLDWHLNK